MVWSAVYFQPVISEKVADNLFVLGVLIPRNSVSMLNCLSAISLPVCGRLHFDWIYLTYEKVEIRTIIKKLPMGNHQFGALRSCPTAYSSWNAQSKHDHQCNQL
jgi:hypothetical protein